MTALFGTISVLGSFADGGGRFQHGCARAWARLVLRLAGVRLRVGGLDRLSVRRPRILCVNHQSDMDIPVLIAALPDPFRFAAKMSLFKVPFLGWHLRRAGHIPIDRENARAALRALDGSSAEIQAGLPVVVFPEGRISRDGALGEFRRGAFMLAKRAGAEVVPIRIRGTRDVLRPSSWTLRGGDVEVSIEPGVPSDRLEVGEMAAVVRRSIESAPGPRSPGGPVVGRDRR